jgi:hypothetical protein
MTIFIAFLSLQCCQQDANRFFELLYAAMLSVGDVVSAFTHATREFQHRFPTLHTCSFEIMVPASIHRQLESIVKPKVLQSLAQSRQNIPIILTPPSESMRCAVTDARKDLYQTITAVTSSRVVLCWHSNSVKADVFCFSILEYYLRKGIRPWINRDPLSCVSKRTLLEYLLFRTAGKVLEHDITAAEAEMELITALSKRSDHAHVIWIVMLPAEIEQDAIDLLHRLSTHMDHFKRGFRSIMLLTESTVLRNVKRAQSFRVAELNLS